MENIYKEFYREFWTFGIIVLAVVFKRISNKLIETYGMKMKKSPTRTMRAKRLMFFPCVLIGFLGILLIWGVKLKEFSLILTATFTIIGAGFFASWSNLSNITSGVILFFYYDLKLGDRLELNYNGELIVAKVWDMKLFYIELISQKGKLIVPNNQMLHTPILKLRKKGPSN